jgi:hypothetical protein
LDLVQPRDDSALTLDRCRGGMGVAAIAADHGRHGSRRS